MSKASYTVIEGFTRKIKKKYLVIDGVTRKLTKKYSCVQKLVGYSEKNLLPAAAFDVYENNGIVYTRNIDGSIHVKGTALKESYAFIETGDSPLALNAGDYVLSLGENEENIIADLVELSDFALPVIIAQPTNYYGPVGDTAEFTVVAAGEGLSYRWEILKPGDEAWAGTTMPGNRTATLSVEAALGRNGNQYRCYVYNTDKDFVICEPATLTVSAIKIAKQPEDVTMPIGGKATYAVEAEGEGLTYLWQYSNNGTDWMKSPLTGADTDRLVVPVTASRNGMSYRCKISDADGKLAISRAATLTVGERGKYAISEETEYAVYLKVSAGAVVDAVIYPQLEAGSVATEYDPYEIWKSFTRLVYSATEDISAAEITLASGTLTYNGSSQTKNVSSVVLNGKTLVEGTDYTVSGNTGTNAGSYTLTITGIGDYEGTATAAWSIAKATGKISVSPTSLSIAGVKGTTKTATISYTGDGSISVKSGSTGVATVTRSGNTVTVTSVATGTATITITLAAGTNYTGANCTISVSSTVVSATLDSNTWATIKSVAADGANYWSVGDCKSATINGTVGSYKFNSEEWYCYIIGFNHNSSVEGNGIHFQFGKTAATNGVSVAFWDNNESFYMWTNYTYDAWSSTVMYKTTCPAFLSALSSSLQSVISACTKYTDNVGDSTDTAKNVTATSSKIWLLSEFEVFGKRNYANTAEKNYQKQYAYYANGNSVTKYRHNATTTGCTWFTRSIRADSRTQYCVVQSDASPSDVYSGSHSVGFAPAFKIA